MKKTKVLLRKNGKEDWNFDYDGRGRKKKGHVPSRNPAPVYVTISEEEWIDTHQWLASLLRGKK